MRRLLLLGSAIVALAVLLFSPSGASAHATLIRSQPAENTVLPQAPIEVLVWFTEAVEIGYSEIQVVDANGARQDNVDTHVHTDPTNPGVTLKPNLPPGTYTAIWRVLSSVDGHRTAGTFAFSVGQVTGPPLPGTATPAFTLEEGSAPPRGLAVLNRWLAFAGMAALIGAVGFPLLVLPGALSAIKPDDRLVAERAGRAIRVTIVAALVVLTLTTAASLWIQAWSAVSDATSLSALQDVWTDTRFGEILTIRVSVLIGAFLLCAVAFQRLPLLLERRDFREPAWLALGIAALALPLTTSLNSHAAAERNETELYVFVDWLHLATGGLWIGGLLQLILLCTLILPLTEKRAAFLGAIIPRFSQVALASVAIIVATGVFQWWNRLRGITSAFDSDYGYTLLVKVGLLAPLLLLAAFNLLIVRPRFLSFGGAFMFQGVRTASSRILAWERRFRWAVAAEVAVALVILGVTALLTETSTPTRESAASTSNGAVNNGTAPTPSALVQSLRAEDLDVSLDVYPLQAGQNDLSIFLNDADGDEKPIQQVIVRFKYLDEDLGENEDFAEAFHPPTHYILTTSQISLTGSWQIEIIVRREGLLDARGTFTVNIAA